ncbi:MAG: hypothetical protein HeimC2_34290 [Candidatus Heimdallarchaeota archaeon LC_2]|nr:MAG: hypothetical protein HeimC2_34290 [Candidatus Heimdallarchaeota archaeon LC_2]
MASDEDVPPRHGESWSEDEEATLLKLKNEGKTNREASNQLNRTESAIKSKLARLKHQSDIKNVDNETYFQNFLNIIKSFSRSFFAFFSFNAILSIFPIIILLLLLTPIGLTELDDTYHHVPNNQVESGNRILLEITVNIQEIDFSKQEVTIDDIYIDLSLEHERNNDEQIYSDLTRNLVVNNTQYLYFMDESILLYIYFKDDSFLTPDKFPIDSYLINFEIKYLSDILKDIEFIENYSIVVDFNVNFSVPKYAFRKKINEHGIDFEEINESMILDSYNIEFVLGRSDYSKLFFLLPPIIFFSILTINGYTKPSKEKMENAIKISALNIGFMFSIVTLIPIDNSITLAESLTMGTILFSLFQILFTMIELNSEEKNGFASVREPRSITRIENLANHINKNMLSI